MRDAVPSVGRDHDEFAAILTQKIDDGSRRLLQFEANVVDLDSELSRDDPGRIVHSRQPPLHKQVSRVRERQCFGGVVLGHVKEVQFASSRQGDAQGVGERGRAQIGKIGRVHDRTDGGHCKCSY